MIPLNGIDFETGVSVSVSSSRTYYINDIDNESKKPAIKGFVEGMASIRQAIYKVLRTEKGRYNIYNSDYGIRLEDLIGKSKTYVYSQIEQRVTDALLADNRIREVYDFSMCEGESKGSICISFFVGTTEGDESVNMEVSL